jgi:hypothetical protein
MSTWIWFTIWSLGLIYVSYRAGLFLGLRHIRASAEKIAQDITNQEVHAEKIFGGLKANMDELKKDLNTAKELEAVAMQNIKSIPGSEQAMLALVPHLPTLMKNLPGIKRGIDKLNEGELLRMDDRGIFQDRPEGRKDLIVFDESVMELIGAFIQVSMHQNKG